MRSSIPLLVLTLTLSGCDRGSPEYLLEDYMSRVSNTIELDINTQLKPGDVIPLFPRKRERVKETEEIRQGVIEVLDLKYCIGMLNLIAQRNSNLGRVMQPSQQMIYEIRFFRNLLECRHKLRNDASQPTELRQQLNEIYQAKLRNLKKEIWNGIYGSDEMAANFSRSEPAIPVEGETGFSAARNALNEILLIAAITPENAVHFNLDKLDSLEASYNTLHTNRYGSQLLKSVVLLTETMERTAAAIHTRLDTRAFCHPGHRTRKREILHNVFVNFYSQKFQPYLSRVHRDGEQWRQMQLKLIQQFDAEPAIRRYYDQTLSPPPATSLWNRYIQARDNHTKAWQRILGQCDLMPGR